MCCPRNPLQMMNARTQQEPSQETNDNTQRTTSNDSRPDSRVSRRRSRRVAFAPAVEGRFIAPVPSRYHSKVWYTSEERTRQRQVDLSMADLTKQCPQQLNSLRNYFLNSHPEWTARGLEAFVSQDGIQRKRGNKVQAILSVLVEQRRLEAENNENSVDKAELIRDACLRATLHCHKEARDRGIQDTAAAMEKGSLHNKKTANSSNHRIPARLHTSNCVAPTPTRNN